MPLDVDTLYSAAMALPPEDRETLAEKLLDSLTEENRAEIEAAWAEEAEARITAYDQGKLKAIPADEVHRSLPPETLS